MWNWSIIVERRGIAALIAAMALTAPVTAVAQSNELSGIRLHDAPDSTRVVLDTSAAASYKVLTLDNPHRIVIDLRRTKPKGSVIPEFDSRVVKGIRAARRRIRDYRVVLDLHQPVEPKELVLQPIAPYGHRLVIDLFPTAAGAAEPSPPMRRPDGKRDVVVAIDAGHGGEDPGAIGPGRIYEKRVVLAIARAIKKNLDAMPGLRAALVRDGDYYVPLRKRTAIARGENVRADVFISIHADAFRLPSVHGASVYALSERGASSETARWLAAAENRSDLIGGVSGSWVSLDEVPSSVAEVLVDLSMDHKMEASIALGEAVLGALGTVTKLHKKRVEQAGFVVLKSPDVPSILIETGFISNREEARRLADAGFQRRLGRAIADGIQGHLLRSPPQDTLLATLSDGGTVRYVIKRGDTLSEIAQRNRVSMRRLRAVNSLSSDRIRVGQILLIPFGGGGGS